MLCDQIFPFSCSNFSLYHTHRSPGGSGSVSLRQNPWHRPDPQTEPMYFEKQTKLFVWKIPREIICLIQFNKLWSSQSVFSCRYLPGGLGGCFTEFVFLLSTSRFHELRKNFQKSWNPVIVHSFRFHGVAQYQKKVMSQIELPTHWGENVTPKTPTTYAYQYCIKTKRKKRSIFIFTEEGRKIKSESREVL